MDLKWFVMLIVCSLAKETYEDVGKTQICIWLPITLALTTIYAVYLMGTMESERDSILYAKFLTTEAEGRERA